MSEEKSSKLDNNELQEESEKTKINSLGSKGCCSSNKCTADHAMKMFNQVTSENKDGSHPFWDSQPVPKSHDVISPDVSGPIDTNRNKSELRQTPYDLPSSLEWSDVDTCEENQLDELYELLKNHYVKDDENLFQFAYPKKFLLWTLKPPGFKPIWHVCVRQVVDKEMVGFIAAIPIKVQVTDKTLNCVDINFLCLHEKLRNKRLAPLLIQEITRRVNLCGIFQAVHTAGHLYSQPFTQARYYHRNLNIKKVVDTEFGSLPGSMTMKMGMKFYSLPQEPLTKGFREMRSKDIIQACSVLAEYTKRFKVHAVYHQERFRHEFFHKGDCVYSYVVENDGVVSDFISFYSLPSTVLNNKLHKTLNVAYLYSAASTKTPLQELIKDVLIEARNKGFDVFNALDLMENLPTFEKLKFIPGGGVLKYYFFNWLCPTLEPSEVALILQ